MRKLNKKQRIALPILILFEMFVTALLVLCIYNYRNGYKWNTLPDKKIKVVYTANGLNLKSKGVVRSRSAAKAEAALEKMGNVAKSQAHFGVTIVPKKNIRQINNPNNIYSGDPDNYKTAAYFTSGENTIVISDADNVDWLVSHEMGHYVDYTFWPNYRISEDENWLEIVEEEFPNTGWDKYHSRPSEFWAECFAAYYNDPGWLYCHCTRAFSIIEQVVGYYE